MKLDNIDKSVVFGLMCIFLIEVYSFLVGTFVNTIIRYLLYAIAVLMLFCVCYKYLNVDYKMIQPTERYSIVMPKFQYVSAFVSIVVSSYSVFICHENHNNIVDSILSRNTFFSIAFLVIGVISMLGIRSCNIFVHRLIVSPAVLFIACIILTHNIHKNIYITIAAAFEGLIALVLGLIFSDNCVLRQLKRQ